MRIKFETTDDDRSTVSTIIDKIKEMVNFKTWQESWRYDSVANLWFVEISYS